MNKKGRPPLPPEERKKRQLESYSKSRLKILELYKHRKSQGLCRTCGKQVCGTSSVFCEQHLRTNREASKNSKRKLYTVQKGRAKQRGIQFTFSENEFYDWINLQKRECHYCKITEAQLMEWKDRKDRLLTIDRKDNAKGYELGNVCLACMKCNALKSNFFSECDWSSICQQFIQGRLRDYHLGQ